MFCRVLKKVYKKKGYIWCDTVSSEPKTQKQTLKRTITTFNYNEI